MATELKICAAVFTACFLSMTGCVAHQDRLKFELRKTIAASADPIAAACAVGPSQTATPPQCIAAAHIGP